MSPNTRYRLIEEIMGLLPLTCPGCQPGCPDASQCRRDIAEDIVDVVERELQS